MTDPWRRVDEVLQAALLCPPDERDRFVRHECAGDTALETEVRSLLAADEQAGSFLEDPAIHAAARGLADSVRMALSPGSRLGPYEISAQIGAGGMGEVYRALDTNLARQVAIKVLPEAVAADADRLARFEREAKTLAALNHPNIAAIYGLERNGGTIALVMELVEGLTLADRTAQGAIPVSEALPIARQIAEALEAAHEQGIIHRDLKPANIKLRPDGTIKVLDFGLAKQTAIPGPDDVIPPQDEDSVVGGVVGTPAYMSPEQARGERADKRTDIWAFGCVLFEMLIGRRLFDSTMVADRLALVMTREIDWSVLPTQLPPAVRALLRRCLERDPRKRLRDVAAIRFALEDVAGSADALPASPAPRRIERTAWFVAGTAMLITVVLAAALYVVSRPHGAPPLRLSMTLPEGWSLALSSSQGEPTSLVLSPNGQRVAIVARRADGPSTILMRELDSSAARPLAGTEGATSLFWSPDNRFIGFFAEGKVKKVDLLGGVPTVVCDATAPFGGGAWSHEGTIVFSMQDKGNYRLWKVADSGGQPTHALPDGPAGQQTNGQEIRPWFLPDGRTLLYVNATLTKSAVYAGRLGSPDRVKVVETDASNVQYANGYLLFLRGAALMAQAFDEKRLAVTGNPVQVVEHVQRQGAIPPYRLFSASQNGVLAYQPATEAATLAWLDRRGQTLGTIGERANYRAVALSHDETRVVAVMGEPPNLFNINLANGVRTQLTFDRGTWPVWSHDDRFIDFAFTPPGGRIDGYRKLSNGAGASERILPHEKRPAFPFDRGWDDSLLMMIQRDHPGADLTVLPATGNRTPFRLASTPQDKRIGKFSPDARWVAYVSNELGSVQKVWVAPVVRGTGAGDVKYLISTGAEGGTLPQWSADGRELFYISSSEMLTGVQVNGDGQAFQALALPKALFPIRVSQSEGGYNGWHYAVAKDGRFLVIRGSEEPVSIEVDWTAGLKR